MTFLLNNDISDEKGLTLLQNEGILKLPKGSKFSNREGAPRNWMATSSTRMPEQVKLVRNFGEKSPEGYPPKGAQETAKAGMLSER